MDLIRQAADAKCSDHLVKSIDTIDKILEYGKPWVKKQLKGLFGLAALEKDDDFAAVLEVSFDWNLNEGLLNVDLSPV